MDAAQGLRSERVVQNERYRAAINDELAGRRADAAPGEPVELACECGDPSCHAVVPLSLEAYAAVRAHERRFVVVPGHEFPALERVVEHDGRYAVVELL